MTGAENPMGTGYLSPASKWGRDGGLSAIFLAFARRLHRVSFGQDPELEIELPQQKLDLLRETEMPSPIATIRDLRQELKAPRERTTRARFEGLASRKKLVQWLACGTACLGFHANPVLQ